MWLVSREGKVKCIRRRWRRKKTDSICGSVRTTLESGFLGLFTELVTEDRVVERILAPSPRVFFLTPH